MCGDGVGGQVRRESSPVRSDRGQMRGERGQMCGDRGQVRCGAQVRCRLIGAEAKQFVVTGSDVVAFAPPGGVLC